jgi:hypothetical protein
VRTGGDGGGAGTPAPTTAGVFGIERMTRAPDGSRRSIAAVDTPAASEMTSAPGATASAISRSTRSRICGLTDSTRICDCRATSRLSPVARIA